MRRACKVAFELVQLSFKSFFKLQTLRQEPVKTLLMLHMDLWHHQLQSVGCVEKQYLSAVFQRSEVAKNLETELDLSK